MSEVITFGEPMVVWIPHQVGSFSEVETFSKGLAGAELNVAIGIARLEHSVSYLTKLGGDVVGTYILDRIKEEGISTDAIAIDPDSLTGTYFKTKVTEGDPAVFYMRKNSAASQTRPEDIDKVDFSGVKFVHLTGISAAIAPNCYASCERMEERTREQAVDAIITFDPNIRPSLWPSVEVMAEKLNALAFRADIVLPGIAEGRILTGCETPEEIADFYLSRGTRRAVIVKTGSKGAFYKTAEGRSGLVPGIRIEKIVDTVGAGDAFAASVITGLLEGMDYEGAIARGNAMGALMVTSPGDNEAMPTREGLEAFLEAHR